MHFFFIFVILFLERWSYYFMIIIRRVKLSTSLRMKYLSSCSKLLRTSSIFLIRSWSTLIFSMLRDLVHLSRFINIEVSSFFLIFVKFDFTISFQNILVIKFLLLVSLHDLFVIIISHWGVTNRVNITLLLVGVWSTQMFW